MKSTASDRNTLRELAKRYADLCRDPDQQRRREVWRRHNSLHPVRPPIYVRAFGWSEMAASHCVCRDPLFRRIENHLRGELFRTAFRDDYIFEPWVSVEAEYACTGWGVEIHRIESGVEHGAFKVDYAIREPEDFAKLRPPRHEIDEAATAAKLVRVQEAIGDLIAVNLDRGPYYRMWTADLSTDLGLLRGIEHLMLDMLDRPEWYHQLLAFLRDGVLRAQDKAEADGDWGLCDHQNQAMPYAEELQDPAANARGVRRSQLWCFMAAQEYTGVSPAMHNEFLLQYQLPILRKFGLVAYGCCEDLTHKIGILRQIPNLRRIAVSPFANVARCAEQIGRDYVLSYRPSPADMVSYGFDEHRIRTILRRDLQACRNCFVDITLKDVETVQGDPSRVGRWVAIARQEIEAAFG
jgi:hypothetical protein